MKWFDSIFTSKKTVVESVTTSKPLEISIEPDTPQPFGYKLGWLVVKEENPEEVMKKIGCEEIRVSNWESAFKTIFAFKTMVEEKDVFVTPCFDGYIAILNVVDLFAYEERLNEIVSSFEEVQYFESHRVVDLSCWARYYGGKINRRYCYVGEQGRTYWNDGELTKEEIDLHLNNLPGVDCEELDNWDDWDFPDEEVVRNIAAQWGIDPSLDKYQNSKSTGYLCKLRLG